MGRKSHAFLFLHLKKISYALATIPICTPPPLEIAQLLVIQISHFKGSSTSLLSTLKHVPNR